VHVHVHVLVLVLVLVLIQVCCLYSHNFWPTVLLLLQQKVKETPGWAYTFRRFPTVFVFLRANFIHAAQKLLAKITNGTISLVVGDSHEFGNISILCPVSEKSRPDTCKKSLFL